MKAEEKMPAPGQSGPTLVDIRRKIDACDDGIVALLAQRFALIEEVKHAKEKDGTANGLPLRPSREAVVLRRLVKQAVGTAVDPELLVRLWPLIFAEATLKQSPVTIHVARKLGQNVGLRLRIRDYYGQMAVEEYRDEAQALIQVNANPNDICIVETESLWAEAFMHGKAGNARVFGSLPVARPERMPKLLVIGEAPAEATGEDETLVITKGNLPRDFAPQPLWQAKSGGFRLSALAGFYSERESPLVGLTRSNIPLGLKVAGRYARAIEV